MKKLIFVLFVGILASVAFGQTKVEMKTADLPKPIKDYFAKNAKTLTIVKAFKVDSKGVITYDILVAHGADKSVFIFDKEGKFVQRAVRSAKGGAQNAVEPKPQTDPLQKAPPAGQAQPQPQPQPKK
jgi:hypothetical protein